MIEETLTINTADEILREIEKLEVSENMADSPSFLTSYTDFINKPFNDGEVIAFHAMRGEVVLVQSVTNKGKSTLVRNAAFTLASGNSFPPIAEAGTPRKVLLLNLEGSGGRFQADIKTMEAIYDKDELNLLRENFFPTHAPLIDDEPLSLSRHMMMLEYEAQRHQVDVVIIDTASAAFSIRNENDNAEVANLVMKPLLKLARKLNCVVVLVHHIGKAKSEDGTVREAAHRGRGASAWADFSTSIFNLEADSGHEDRITLTCGKRKDGEKYSDKMRLDRAARWFTLLDETPSEIPLTRQSVRSVITHAMPKRDILEALKESGYSVRTIERCLSDDIKDRLLVHPKRGWYALPDPATTATSYVHGGNGGTSIFDDEAFIEPIEAKNDLPF